MSKIIKVSGCHECDNKKKHTRDTPFGEERRYYCPKWGCKQVEWYITNKTLPVNCPLEEEK